MDPANFSTAKLADVDARYYYGVSCQSYMRSARLSLSRLRGLLGDDFPVVKVRTRLKCSTCGSKQLTVTFLARHQAVGNLAHLFNEATRRENPAMCGRYVSPDDAAIELEFTLVRHEWNFPPSYNVAPTQDVPIVRVNKAGERSGVCVHWGLIPFWAKGVQPKYSTINATVEKLTDAATWRGPWNRGQRCILPALGFFEWQVQSDGKSKQPFYITLNDQDVFGFAGLWNSSTGADGVAFESCTIVTCPLTT